MASEEKAIKPDELFRLLMTGTETLKSFITKVDERLELKNIEPGEREYLERYKQEIQEIINERLLTTLITGETLPDSP